MHWKENSMQEKNDRLWLKYKNCEIKNIPTLYNLNNTIFSLFRLESFRVLSFIVLFVTFPTIFLSFFLASFAQTQEARNNNSAHTTQKLSSAPNEIRKPQKYETGKILNAQRSKSPVPREASVKGYSEESAAKTVPAELSSTENNSELEAVIEKPETSPSPGTSQTSDIDSRENGKIYV